MAGHGVRLQQRHAVDHVLTAARIGAERTLPGVAAIEQQHLAVAFGTHLLDHRRQPIEAADLAVAFGKRGEIPIGHRIGGGRFRRDAEFGEEIRAGQMRRQSLGGADAKIDARLAEIDRHQLAVDVGDVQQRDIADRIEAREVVLRQSLLGEGTRETTSANR